jgi:hypothetical protein
MADQLYLSLWFPNFRFADLPAKLTAVMRQFARISGQDRVRTAAVYPISFSEAPTYQRLYVNDERTEPTDDSLIENAVAEGTEVQHEDCVYEFEMSWQLWQLEAGGSESLGLDSLWKSTTTTVRILGFGPEFDDATFEQNGHIRIDFGLDTPWTFDTLDDDPETEDDPELSLDDDYDLDDADEDTVDEQTAAERRAEAQGHIQQNVEKLLAFTLSVEKHCGISSRLLWTESGEPLAEKLIAQLQRLN